VGGGFLEAVVGLMDQASQSRRPRQRLGGEHGDIAVRGPASRIGYNRCL
jgi:hypothetical protein